MNEQEKITASQRVVQLTTQRELTEAEQVELTNLRELLAAQPDLNNPEEDFINPLITNSGE
ncbi:hypothetical protein AHMF7616_00997 [Adhaeribacter pallidiroseus]|uniref:Uncharacterized protein n=2 Tax=Adhaeribacter pallidiroseus TaxID=2072847 RepID=A0A369QBX8_9BACT|nr:hypothetical protein AHMF7616_00997 [Adhaeribacter pallidiroseus]